jgi:hypothetical protein
VEGRKLLVDEFEAANLLSLSVHFLRKDRRGKRIIPFVKLGARVLYDPDRVRSALCGLEEGGTSPSKARKTAAAAALRTSVNE